MDADKGPPDDLAGRPGPEGGRKSGRPRVANRTQDGVDKQSFDRLQQTVAGLTDELARSTAASLERVESAIAALKDERDWQAAVFAQLEEVVTALAEGENRNQAALTRLARLEDRLDRLIATLSGPPEGPDSPTGPEGPLLAELDTRFDDLLVALADQFDTPVPAVRQSLDEIQARLDEIVGLLADQPSPAVDDALGDLRQAVERLQSTQRPFVSDPTSADERGAIIERLDQLFEQVDALRRRIPVRAKPGTGPGGLDEAILAAISSAVATQLDERPSRSRRAVIRNPVD